MLAEISTAKVKVNKISGLRPVLEVNWLAARLSQNHKSEKTVSRKALKPKRSLFDTIEETEVLRQPHSTI